MADLKETNPAKDALGQTADFIRLSSGLVTAVLGASFVFFSGAGTTAAARPWLYAAWIVMLVSALASLVVYAVIPPKFEDEDYTLHDSYLNWAGFGHLGTFVLGLILLAIGLAISAFQQDHVSTAQAAIDQARGKLVAGHFSVVKIELIKGTGPFGTTSNTWHIQAAKLTPAPTSPAGTMDVFIDADSGTVTSYEMLAPTPRPVATPTGTLRHCARHHTPRADRR